MLPEVATIAELIKGFDGNGWQGLWAPAGAPAAVMQQLHRAALAALADAEVRNRFVDSGLEIVGRSPEQVATKVATESRKWAAVVRFARVTLD